MGQHWVSHFQLKYLENGASLSQYISTQLSELNALEFESNCKENGFKI